MGSAVWLCGVACCVACVSKGGSVPIPLACQHPAPQVCGPLPGVSHTTAGECAWGALCSSDAGVDGGEHSPGLEVENGARVRVARVSDRAEGRWRDQCRPSVRSPPPHLYTQSVSARGVNAVVSVVLVASSLEH